MSKLVSAQKAYDLVASSYDKSFQSKTALVEDEIIYGFLRHFLRHSMILDLGCGTAAFLEHITVKPKNYIGGDISKNMAHRSKQKFPQFNFNVFDMAKLPFRNQIFDNVVALWGGISYADPAAIKEALRILKVKGHYVFMFFNDRYKKRKSYILKRHNLMAPFNTVKQVEKLLPAGHKKFGFNFFGDFPNWLPKALILIWLQIERLVAKLLYAHAFVTIVYGEKT